MHNQSQKQSNFLRICYIENMIITCPQDGKNFEVDDSLIPKKGRLVQCGFCGHKWHFNIKQSIKEINKKDTKISRESKNDKYELENKINENFTDIHDDKIVNSKQNDYNENKNLLNFSKFLKFLIVIIISFIGLIIIVDTFKSPLKVVFPQVENMLQNLYETLKDIFLFLKDLIS